MTLYEMMQENAKKFKERCESNPKFQEIVAQLKEQAKAESEKNETD